MSEANPIVEAEALRKSFGRLQALRGVNFRALNGEITGLVGDNGAGKSTLIKVLSGAIHADAGRIRFAGAPVHWRSPAEALHVRN